MIRIICAVFSLGLATGQAFYGHEYTLFIFMGIGVIAALIVDTTRALIRDDTRETTKKRS